MTKQSENMAFGWLLPTGEPRRPIQNTGYTKRGQRVAERISGSFPSLWIPDLFMAEQDNIPDCAPTLN